MSRAFFATCVAFILALTPIRNLSACPNIAGVPDYNCDGDLQLVFLGDSLVYGYGDTANSNRGGYVMRIGKRIPKADVVNLGEQGLHTGPYLLKLKRVLQSEDSSELKDAVFSADIVFLDLGRNDRWEFGVPGTTYRNLKRMAALIHQSVEDQGGISPYVVVAVLMLPNRGSQGPWVKELNELILKTKRAKETSYDLRFDLVSKRLLSSDQVHPTSEGYNQLAATLQKYLQRTLSARMLKNRPEETSDDS